ncbi:Ldh family oxidoreductase [Candidatus Lucifugimonas marina]|uniref:Ldh family oxidoreductase n=1 Tax=Candidatus Lucifugimonas marina TaxID=3038979 RepID=A0AAJ5ZDP0_9CHLR|nr:Ldh family oxidoreductase [SAR202 cluster bacterium JH702]MDG0868699.1 Ldh family oxidoreductase [SAR202 cluster bacterium JH639]WFG35331.1 Ldh family oxidoreductase [SAR202 cluster bacterium JH545]WFG39279.1 Ldh family oxidoreductase [SAR202 cluster bacterium JH1073]
MLERFHVPHDEAVHVDIDDMNATVKEIFLKMGMPDADADKAAEVLVYADIRGIESHGVSNMLRRYVESFGENGINPTPKPKIIREMPAAATLDGDGGHGLVIGPIAMEMAIGRAKTYGIGTITANNGRHFGAAAYHAAMAIPHGMIGVAMTTGGMQVLPVDGAKPMFGLNPIAIAVPTNSEAPFIFDASMSSVAGNKIALAKRLGVDVAPGWITGSDGVPIMEESPVPDEFFMLPSGGTREGGAHKGSSLGIWVEIMCSLIGASGAGPNRRGGAAHHFIAYNIEAFTDLEEFKSDMDIYMNEIKNTPPIPGKERVVYAGLPEHEEEIERRENGIPYHPEVIDWFRGITGELGIEWRLTND